MGRTGDRRLGCSTLASLETVSVNARVVWFSRMQTFHGAVPASVAELVLAFSDGSMRGTHDGRERTGIAIQQTLLLARQHTRWVQLRCNVPQVPTRRNNHLQYIGRLQTLAKIINVNNVIEKRKIKENSHGFVCAVLTETFYFFPIKRLFIEIIKSHNQKAPFRR